MSAVLYSEFDELVRVSISWEYYSVEDVVKCLCPDNTSDEIIAHLGRDTDVIDRLCFDYPYMATRWDGTEKATDCLAIKEINVLELISLLPGARAKRLTSRLRKQEDSRIWKAQHIEENRPSWIKIGEIFEQRRKSLGLSRNKTAKALGVSSGLLRKFEKGEPVSRSTVRYLKKSYTNFLKLCGFAQSQGQTINLPIEDWEREIEQAEIERLYRLDELEGDDWEYAGNERDSEPLPIF